jgi:hypothetical protein
LEERLDLTAVEPFFEQDLVVGETRRSVDAAGIRVLATAVINLRRTPRCRTWTSTAPISRRPTQSTGSLWGYKVAASEPKRLAFADDSTLAVSAPTEK